MYLRLYLCGRDLLLWSCLWFSCVLASDHNICNYMYVLSDFSLMKAMRTEYMFVMWS